MQWKKKIIIHLVTLSIIIAITMAAASSDITIGKSTTTSEAFDKSHPIGVKTEYGNIEGFIHTADDGTKANIFLGVPFAQPPNGELRFERPLPPLKWSDTLQCKEFKNSCIPYHKFWIQNPTFSEDCLYVNIMAPTEPSSDPKGYPVLVYIHGGGFSFGDVIKCGFDKITKTYAKRGIITVTVPYRVGLYGFMSLGTKDEPGNIGLWDQTAALKFVKDNIKNFGGNNNNITIWGQSAGSASVDSLALSPHSRDLFQKVIQASGCALDEWASTAPVIKLTKAIAKYLGCESNDPKEIKAFLKKQKWEDIMEISSTKFVIDDRSKDNYMGWGPRLDDDFFDGKTVTQLIEEAPKKPTIMGLMTLEGGPFLALGVNPSDFKTYSAENITNAIKNRYVPESRAGKDATAIQEELIDFYVKRDAPSNPTPPFYIQRHGDLISDLMFNMEVLKEADLKAKLGWPVYFYFWNHMSPSMIAMFPFSKGAWHSYDLSYSFDQITYAQDKKGDPEIKVQTHWAEIFANFAKTGNPNCETVSFPKYSVEKKEALWLEPEASIKNSVWQDRCEFWEKLEKKYDYNPLRGLTREQIANRYSE